MDETVNPEPGNESPEPINAEAAFEAYLERQANPPAEDADDQQPAEAKPEADETPAEQEQRFKVKVNGEEREVPLSELVKGYSLETDYRVKTSQVAEQSRAAQAQFEQAQAMQAHYAQQLQTYQQQLAQMQPSPPDPSLIDADPVGYLRQQQAYQGWQQQVQRAQYESQQLAAQQAAQQQQHRAATLAEQAEMLGKVLPEFADPEKSKAVKSEVIGYLKKLGYSEAELSSTQDHRAVVLARKAQLYDQMLAKQSAANAKVASLPPKAPQRPGTGSVGALDGRTRAMQSLKRSGSVEDAANAFASMLGAR